MINSSNYHHVKLSEINSLPLVRSGQHTGPRFGFRSGGPISLRKNLASKKFNARSDGKIEIEYWSNQMTLYPTSANFRREVNGGLTKQMGWVLMSSKLKVEVFHGQRCSALQFVRGSRWRCFTTWMDFFHKRRCSTVPFLSGSRWRCSTTQVKVFHMQRCSAVLFVSCLRWRCSTGRGFMRFVVLRARGTGRRCRLSPSEWWFEVNKCLMENKPRWRLVVLCVVFRLNRMGPLG